MEDGSEAGHTARDTEGSARNGVSDASDEQRPTPIDDNRAEMNVRRDADRVQTIYGTELIGEKPIGAAVGAVSTRRAAAR